jgi:hypothetical protein
MVSSAASLRVRRTTSATLTNLSTTRGPLGPLIPTKVGTQGYTHRNKAPWIPACAGMSGGMSVRCRITPSGFRGRRNPIPNNLNALTNTKCRTTPPRTYGARTRHILLAHRHEGGPRRPKLWMSVQWPAWPSRRQRGGLASGQHSEEVLRVASRGAKRTSTAQPPGLRNRSDLGVYRMDPLTR